MLPNSQFSHYKALHSGQTPNVTFEVLRHSVVIPNPLFIMQTNKLKYDINGGFISKQHLNY